MTRHVEQRLWTGFVASLIVASLHTSASAQPLPRVVVSGLKAPSRLLPLDTGQILVAENGDGPNTGRVSVVTTDGRRFTLIDGLPSGPSAPANDASGASALALRNRTLYIAIGAGDGVKAGPLPGTEMPNPTPSSPIVSSLLALDLDRSIEASAGGYLATPANHATLAARQPVTLTSPSGERAVLRLVVDIPNFIPNPRPDYPQNVKTSNPFGLELGDGCTLFLVDASRDTVWRVDVCANTYAAAAQFPQYTNPLPVGARMIDAVPTSARAYNGDLLVTFLTGAPFPPGLAEVRRVKPATGASESFFKGLRMALDVLPYAGSTDGFFVLEFSQDPATGRPGRVLWFDSPVASGVVLTDALVTPTHLAIHPKTGELLVCELGPGRISAISIPR